MPKSENELQDAVQQYAAMILRQNPETWSVLVAAVTRDGDAVVCGAGLRNDGRNCKAEAVTSALIHRVSNSPLMPEIHVAMARINDAPGFLPMAQIRADFEDMIRMAPHFKDAFPLTYTEDQHEQFVSYANQSTQLLYAGFSLGMRTLDCEQRSRIADSN